MKTKTKLLLLFTMTLLGGATAGAATEAHAWTFWRRIPATTCFAHTEEDGYGNQTHGYPPYIARDYGTLTNSGDLWSDLWLTCPIIDDNTMPKNLVTQLWVDANVSTIYRPVKAFGCTQDNFDTGAGCTSFNQSSGTGHQGILIAAEPYQTGLWPNDSTYAFVLVDLPGGSSMQGMATYR
jgi:hypothetical protein